MSNVISQVLKVEVYWLKCNPPILVVWAIGVTNTGGWTNPRLNPHMYFDFQEPNDGIQSFTFTADPPSGPATQVLSFISAFYMMTNVPKWLKGVRVLATENELVHLLEDTSPRKELTGYSPTQHLTGILKPGVEGGCWELWPGKSPRYSLFGKIKPEGSGKQVYLTGRVIDGVSFCRKDIEMFWVDWMSTNEPKFI